MTSDADTRLTPRHWLALFALLVAALVPGFFSIPVMDRDEARYSQASAQMIESGDYVDIHFQDQPRHVKPAGIYWMQVATAAPFGGPDAPIWAFRLPSLIGVLLGAAVTAWLAARIVGPTGGVVAGTILGLTLMAAVEARTAKTDAMLLAAGVIAQAALYFLLVRGRDGPKPGFIGAPLIFWAATGVALMIKGPIVTLVSASTIVVYGLWTRDKGVLARLQPLRGLIVAAVIALPWLIAINVATKGEFFEASVGHALFGKVAEGDDSHGAPPGYHTLLLPLTFWPGFLLVGLAGALAWTKRRDDTVKFLLSWLIPTWIIFELIATKLPHYVFPALPALAILAAWGVKDAGTLLSHRGTRIVHVVIALLFGFATAVIALLPLIVSRYLPAELADQGIEGMSFQIGLPIVLSLIFGFCALAAGIAVALKPQDLRRLFALGIAAIGVYWAVFEGTIPRLHALFPSSEVAKVVAGLEGCEEIAATTAGYREPSNVRHLGTETFLANTGDDSARFLGANAECGVAIIDRTELESFEAEAGTLGLSTRKVGEVRGINYAKGDGLVLGIFIAEDGKLTPSAVSD